MKHTIRCAVLMLVLGASLVGGSGPARAEPDVLDTELHHEIAVQEQYIDSWQLKARVAHSAAMLVAVLGVVLALLQTRSEPRWRILCAGVGLVVGSLTAVNGVAYPTDHNTIFCKVAKARALLRSARLYLMNPVPDDTRGQQAYLEGFQAKLDAIDAIWGDLYVRSPAPVAETLLTRPAYAEVSSAAPPWADDPTNDAGSVYFTGIGHSPSLMGARRDSLEDARRQARRFIAAQLELSLPELRRTVDFDAFAKSLPSEAGVVDTSFTYSETGQLFSHYTRLRVLKRQIERTMVLAAASRGVAARQSVGAAVGQLHGTGTEYEKGRQESYVVMLDQANASLTPQQYARLIDARELRKAGQYQQAIPLLEALVGEEPSLYIAWFNLALAYEDSKQPDKARRAYEAAARLETDLPSRDAALYCAYGSFLFSSGAYPAAVTQLEHAVALQPEYAVARRTLERAREKSSDATTSAP